MAPTRKSEGLLARVNFPLYTLQMLTSRHVLVGGGGGSAKTGVANGFEIFELSYDGTRFSAEEVIRHETGPKVVMNSACFSDKKSTFLVAGQESHCQLYRVGISVEKEVSEESMNGTSDPPNLRHRKTSKNHQNGISEVTNNVKKKLVFKFNSGDSIQSDFSEKEPCQRVVTISRCGGWMATGGTDGIVRIWSFPGLRMIRALKAHTKELDDLHFSPDSKQVASVAKDGQAIIWELKSGKQIHKLDWTHPTGIKYLFKRCRFGVVEGKGCRLFTTANPVAGGKEAQGWIHAWDDGRISKSTAVSEPTSALAVRDDGVFIAIGTMFTGSVSIYIAFSLQRVLHVEGAHSMFVTGVELLPCSSAWGAIEAAALSISVDNRVCIHSLPFRKTLPPWLVIIIILFTLLFTFVLCSFIGL
ncbi:unnamed protein product [Nezara viridula]|uniref:Prolactin regulatory element-binding protein n=1 Tax=Nezara viridula TaxID=85310 RepID=A0A9P0DZG8_NEZVI|nr:unnamed protein product [Nezara viridula]